MRNFLISYAASVALFPCMDFVWLGLTLESFYKPQLQSLMLENYYAPAAVVFYLVYGIGLAALAVLPALASGSWRRAALGGALLGLTAYGTYDLTNMATLKNWSLALTVVDMAWGAFATAVVATASFLITRRFSTCVTKK
jgi:uncharacterized membrane protein